MKSLLVPVEPAITLVRNVMGKLIAETLLMKPTAVSTMYVMCIGVLMLVHTGQLWTSCLKFSSSGFLLAA